MIENNQGVDFTRVTVQGTAVRYLIFFGSKLLLFVSTAVLARLLTKDDFGIVGFAVITISFLEVINSYFIIPAIIYYPESEKILSTAYWANLIIGCAVYGLAWLIAPAVSVYFHDSRVIDVIRILSLTFPINSIGDPYSALLSKRLAFDRTVLPELLRAMTKGVTSIGFAFAGFGAWSLVIGQILGEIVSAIAYWKSLSWRPSFVIEITALKTILDYGLKYASSGVVSVVLLNLDYLLVGRFLGVEALGVYTLAFRLPDLIILQFARSLSSVIFPVYSKMREIPNGMAKGFFLTTRYISLLTVPLGLGLALIARPFTQIVFTEKWIEAVPAIQGIAFYSLFLSLSYNAGSAYKASGHPQTITLTALFRLALLFPALWWAVAVARSIVAVSWVQALVAMAGTIMNMLVAAKMLELPLRDLGKALFPAMISGFLMASVVVSFLTYVRDAGPWTQLVGAVLVGGITYIASLWFFNRNVVLDMIQILQGALKKG